METTLCQTEKNIPIQNYENNLNVPVKEVKLQVAITMPETNQSSENVTLNDITRIKNKEKCRLWRLNNKARIQNYLKTNEVRIKARAYKYNRFKLDTDIHYKLGFNLRCRIRSAVNKNQKAGSAVRDLGCSIPEFKKYIESKFLNGMTWDNHGKWHLDHIRPLSSLNLQNREEFLIACHYTNYQPLWGGDNIRKSDKLVNCFK